MKGGRILKVKFGYNPNSSSLGVSVLMVLIGSGLTYLAVATVSTLIRIRRKTGAGPGARPSGGSG